MPQLHKPAAAFTVPTPTRLKGSELERAVLFDYEHTVRADPTLCHMNRYGVQAVTFKGKGSQLIQKTIASLPDFEGVVSPNGRQFTFDCKVCSQASWSLTGKSFNSRQLSHLLDRSDKGAVGFVLLHFNERKLKTKVDKAVTYALPVHRDLPLWQQYEAREIGSVSRDTAMEYGIEIVWWIPKRSRRPRPYLIYSLPRIFERIDECR